MRLRKSLLGLAVLAALTAGLLSSWFAGGRGAAGHPLVPVISRARVAQALERAAAARGLDAAPVRDALALASPEDAHAQGLAQLDGAPGATVDAAAAQASLTPAEQKQVDKLAKKLAKAQSKADKQELKLAELGNDIDAAQNALDAANALPESTAKELKAKAKAIAKATKKLAKLQGKLAKGQAKLDALQATTDALAAAITVIDPEHFAGIVGLQAPEQMSVVTADAGAGGGGSGIFGGGDFLLGSDDFPLLSDYNQDPQHTFVFDPSMDTLSTVNMILCLLKQTAYDEQVNAGTYIAQVDESLCDTGGDDSSSGSSTGQSSGGNAGAPSLWVVKSTRPTADGAQTVKLWVPQEEEGGGDGPQDKAGTIRVKLDVTKGVSDADPFGSFNLNFAKVPIGGELADATNFGNLRTLDVLDGFIGFSFYESEGDLLQEPFPEGEHAQIVQANVNMFDDQSQGVARIRRQSRENFGPDGDTGIQTDEYLLAFNDQTVLRAKNGEQGTCLSRTDFDERVFRYGLYYAQGDDLGARVERNGGFGFKTAGGQYGWIGYYGLWAPPNVSIANGDTITKSTFGSDAAETYTVVSAPGKLIRNTRQQLALADADGEEFNWWDFPSFGPPPMDGGGDPPPNDPPVQYRVRYDGGTGQFLEIATFDAQSGQFSDLPEPVAIDVEAEGNFLQMFSESLGGGVSYVNGDESLTYFTTQFVTGSDALFAEGDDVTLLGFQDSLRAGITGEEATQGHVFLDNSSELASPHRFVFRKSDLTLYYDADGSGSNLQRVGLADGEAPTGGPFTWGMHSGPMLTGTEGLMNTYETWKQPVFYTYETGQNSWNKYQSLVDADGNFVSFDPPLQFTYTHALANDRNDDPTWDGKKFLLNYNGFGDLFGIPSQPFDLDGDNLPDRFYPVFSIKDGVLCGPTGTEYVLKAQDVELSLQEAGPGGCSMQTIDPVSGLQLPDASYYTAPDIGPKPVVTDPPAVIDSMVQESGAP